MKPHDFQWRTQTSSHSDTATVMQLTTNPPPEYNANGSSHDDGTSNFNDLNDGKVLTHPDLPEYIKRQCITARFCRLSRSGDVNAMKELLQEPYRRELLDINGVDSDGCPAIVYGACFGHDNVLRLLLQNQTNVDATDRFGWTPLVWRSN